MLHDAARDGPANADARGGSRSHRASAGALAQRIARGSLPSEKQGNRRVVALADLYAAGLIGLDPGATVTELLDRLEQAYARIGQLEAENRRLRGG